MEQRNVSDSRSFKDCQHRSGGSPRNRQVGDPTHFVQAGASILSNGKPSSLKNCGSGLQFNGEWVGELTTTVGCGLEAATGFGHPLKQKSAARGGVTVLTSPASGPLSLTPPQVELESTMKEGASPPSSAWQEFWDEEVEASYYYNRLTREALWVRPDGF